MRPGYLGDLSDTWFGQVEDEYATSEGSVRYLDMRTNRLPLVRESMYIPEYIKYSKGFPDPHQLVPTDRLQWRGDPDFMPGTRSIPLKGRDFNTLLF